MLGLGYYDINVLEKALDIKGYDLKWFNKKNPINENAIKFSDP